MGLSLDGEGQPSISRCQRDKRSQNTTKSQPMPHGVGVRLHFLRVLSDVQNMLIRDLMSCECWLIFISAKRIRMFSF